MKSLILIMCVLLIVSCGKDDDPESCKEIQSVWHADTGATIDLTNITLNEYILFAVTFDNEGVYTCIYNFKMIGDESQGKTLMEWLPTNSSNLDLTSTQQAYCGALESVSKYEKQCNAIVACELDNTGCVTYL